MKAIFKVLVLGVSFFLLSFSETTAISWQTDVLDLGTIEQGKPKTVEFVFTNTSAKDLSITNVKTSCGCTASEYTKEVIAPGKKGFVKATYNAAVKGNFTKTITVSTNQDEVVSVLTIKGNVE